MGLRNREVNMQIIFGSSAGPEESTATRTETTQVIEHDVGTGMRLKM